MLGTREWVNELVGLVIPSNVKILGVFGIFKFNSAFCTDQNLVVFQWRQPKCYRIINYEQIYAHKGSLLSEKAASYFRNTIHGIRSEISLQTLKHDLCQVNNCSTVISWTDVSSKPLQTRSGFASSTKRKQLVQYKSSLVGVWHSHGEECIAHKLTFHSCWCIFAPNVIISLYTNIFSTLENVHTNKMLVKNWQPQELIMYSAERLVASEVGAINPERTPKFWLWLCWWIFYERHHLANQPWCKLSSCLPHFEVCDAAALHNALLPPCSRALISVCCFSIVQLCILKNYLLRQKWGTLRNIILKIKLECLKTQRAAFKADKNSNAIRAYCWIKHGL